DAEGEAEPAAGPRGADARGALAPDCQGPPGDTASVAARGEAVSREILGLGLRATIELLPRCIIVCRYVNWDCTDIEGVNFDTLDFYESLPYAVLEFCGQRPLLDAWELKTAM